MGSLLLDPIGNKSQSPLPLLYILLCNAAATAAPVINRSTSFVPPPARSLSSEQMQIPLKRVLACIAPSSGACQSGGAIGRPPAESGCVEGEFMRSSSSPRFLGHFSIAILLEIAVLSFPVLWH